MTTRSPILRAESPAWLIVAVLAGIAVKSAGCADGARRGGTDGRANGLDAAHDAGEAALDGTPTGSDKVVDTTGETSPERGSDGPVEPGALVPDARPDASAEASLDATPDALPPPDGGSAVPVGKTVVFVGDYEPGNFSQWGTCQSVFQNKSCSSYNGSHYSLQLVSGGGQRQGQHAARYELRDGDVPNFGGGERTEVSSSGAAGTKEGDERWYEWSMKFDSTFSNPNGGWFIVMQWHAGSGSPPLAINISNSGNVDIGGDGVSHPRRTIGPVRKGQWVDYVLHAKFSQDAGTGFVEAWENGVQTVPKTNRATMSSGSNYLKMGIYRDGKNTATHVLYQDGLRVTAP